MIAVLDPQVRYALILGLGIGAGFGCWLQGWLWWIVMYKAWVRGHEVRRRRRLGHGPLWQVTAAYRRLFADIRRLWCTGRWS